MLSYFNIEIFKYIPGYYSYYKISNLGRIKSLGNNKFHNIHILNLVADSDNYYVVSLYNNKKRVVHKVHRLVLLAFKGESDLAVNHKNCNKQYNKLYNLEYITNKQNTKHAIKHGLMDKSRKILNEHSRNKRIKIKQFNLNNEFMKEYESLREAERMTNINKNNICLCINGKRKSAGGFIWQKG